MACSRPLFAAFSTTKQRVLGAFGNYPLESVCVGSRSYVQAAGSLGKDASDSVDSAAHAVGDTIEKAGENLRESAKDSKAGDKGSEDGMGKRVKNAAETVGDMTAKLGDKIEHGMDDSKDAKSKERNLEDKQVLSN